MFTLSRDQSSNAVSLSLPYKRSRHSLLHSDPDIQHLPFFAISHVFFTTLWSSYYKRAMKFDIAAKFFIPIQHRMFYVVMSLARFNLYALSYGYLAKTAMQSPRARGGRWWWWAEICCLGLFYCWFGAVLKGCGSWPKALMYLLVSHVVTSPLHVQVCLQIELP